MAENTTPQTTEADCGCLRCASARTVGLSFEEQAFLPHRFACEICGNKRCPHHTDHTLACSGSNATGQKGSVYA